MNALEDAALERGYIADLLNSHDQKSLRSHIAQPARLQPSECLRIEHGQILRAIAELAAEKREVSPITASDLLVRQGYGHAAGVIASLCENYEPRFDSISAMSSRLTELARARKVEGLLKRGVEAAQRLHMDAAEEMAREVLGEAPAARTHTQSLRSAAEQAAMGNGSSQHRVIRSGFSILDQAYGGLRPGTMLTVGGRTGAGKSSLMLSMALRMAQMGRKPGIVSCEDAASIWGERALSHVAGIHPQELAAEQRHFQLQGRIEAGLARLREDGVQLCCALNRPLTDVLGAVRDLLANQRCDVIFVDYLQAIRLGHGAKRAELVSDAAQQLKSECQQHGVPFVLGSQLSRPDKAAPYKEPHAYELKESGDIENMSEAIVLLWKTSDESTARMLGKVAKVKWSSKRPRFELRLSESGALHDLEHYESKTGEVVLADGFPRRQN